jgi:hypothetical protein
MHIFDQLLCKSLWLVVWIAYVPLKAVLEGWEIETNLYYLLLSHICLVSDVVKLAVDYHSLRRELGQMIVQVDLSIDCECNETGKLIDLLIQVFA